ncbi:MAG: sulfite exporter TauE/SafE family protein [Planctomycetaceae bacterium]
MTPAGIELPLVFVSGVLGSAHCIGMCGAISAMMNAGTTGIRGALARQLLWSGGRVFTYVFLGLTAAFAGVRFSATQENAVPLQAAFAVIAGLLLIVQGLHAAGWLRWRVRRSASPCLTAKLFSQFLQGGSASAVLVAGVLTGFLPCGLVYSFLALAASTGSLLHGSLVMLAFGAGTIPVMLLTGTGLSVASLATRRRLTRLAAACVLATGLLTVGRGIVFASTAAARQPEKACPFCEARAAAGEVPHEAIASGDGTDAAP